MNDYTTHLKKEGYAITTIKSNERQVTDFKKWCKRNHTTPIEIDYKTCLKYIKYLTRKGNSKRTINHKLGSLKNYFNYLISESYRLDNPIEDTNIKGVRRTLNHNLLEPEELEDLYYSYQTDTYQEEYHKYTSKRNKIIVGLLVYQGLDTKDLKNLKTEHLQLNKGKIYIPGTKKSNAREIELKPWQMMDFMEYIGEVRNKLLERLQTDTDQLFPSGDRFIIVNAIIKKVRKYNQKVQNGKQIRASVITNWLSQYNLRKTQYLAGHRYISSTERYLQDDLENLHEIVNNYHPIQ
ncbi:integrase/recombinase XerD [Aquimarina sp. MAR_2010_214]|uniref:tyrosine-type recombinase/integrase n=1 Tax=Aquimarina sp. MAR_2010_214 TaxID=1250026 RepID=UPI000C6FFE62|nr:tyrosine-type recombinase/integrase [Aquimarina sp. MAR_2010_214]PKV52457.1 integrase/recombinase XerD [Aquimarina sp. MAR_2010_214]